MKNTAARRAFYILAFILLHHSQIPKAEKTFIDNQKLDGFLNGLKKVDCGYISCDKCGYCEKFARKAITIAPDDEDEAIRRSDLFLEKITSSEIFQ